MILSDSRNPMLRGPVSKNGELIVDGQDHSTGPSNYTNQRQTGIRTNVGTAAGGKTPDQPSIWVPPNASSTDVDFRSLYDTQQSCELVVCDAKQASEMNCLRLAANIAPVITNLGTKVINQDFTQGGRTAKQAFELLHHLIAGRPTPRTFYPGVALGATGRLWIVGFATPYPDLLTAGMTVQGAQTILNASQPTLDFTGEGMDPNAGTVPAVAPLGYTRDEQIVRGFSNRPVQLDLSGQIWSAYLHAMWRASSGMDVAMVDLARPQPLPSALAALVRSSWAPGTSASTTLWGWVAFINSTSPLTDVRTFPMAGQSLRINDLVAALGG